MPELIDLLEPFAVSEARTLRRYTLRVGQLRVARYFREESRFAVDMVKGNWDMVVPEAEARRAIAPIVRELYSQSSRASFPQVAGLIKSHARPSRKEALTAVESYEEAVALVLSSWGLDGNSTPSPTTPRQTLEDWLYGEDLHWEDADQVERVERLNAFGLYEWQFRRVVARLGGLYDRFARRIVQPILDDPRLLRT